MSQESAKAFYAKLQQDEELSQKIKELKTEEAIKEYVQEELGYEFTPDEMEQVIFEQNPELTDEELEAVVGGADGENGIIPGIAIGIAVGGSAGIGMIGIGVGIAAAAAA
eukprot:gnl/Chilomastix_cuspidata/9464.p1 GENE.gnl/Chilomastix_cuspidata/9464~~gnl/Chilomastix_cuspidata/9464.p1  ORF type:complete len:110 (-),score=1.24 gnl/Chilomastix_cuspidata/9464:332-661(-)